MTYEPDVDNPPNVVPNDGTDLSMGGYWIPAAPLSVQPGAPHTAAMDHAFAERTRNGWYKLSGTSRSWFWPSPESAPYIETTAINANTTFIQTYNSVDHDLELPWLHQKGATSIRCVLGVGVAHAMPDFKIRMGTKVLVDAVATTWSELVPIYNPLNQHFGPWKQYKDPQFYVLVEGIIDLPNPTMPASRRVALTFQGNFDMVSEASGGLVNRTARIMSILAFDERFGEPTF